MRDTIFAVATAAGRGAVAVVRLSGPQAGPICRALCGALPPPRRASLRRLRSGGELLDEALVLWMPAPASFTGEDCVEFHTHGGLAVVDAVSDALMVGGARYAEAGEFTRRAFESGRLDLTQAEAIADLVDAETQSQRRQAQAQFSGALSARYQVWIDILLDASAMIEAAIDFPEDDVPDGITAKALSLLTTLEHDLRSALADGRGERVRRGLRIAIVGAPNVGKSSLLNLLSERDAAIVTSVAGTTRDVVEVNIYVQGQAIVLADTAGLRETHDPIEAEGVSRARRWADEADLRIVVADAGRAETVSLAVEMLGDGDILVINKIDVLSTPSPNLSLDAVYVSVLSGEILGLTSVLKAKVTEMTAGATFPGVTRTRHREILGQCLENVVQARENAVKGAELLGESVRLARRCLERLTGRGDPEAVLDRVFSTFCIGK